MSAPRLPLRLLVLAALAIAAALLLGLIVSTMNSALELHDRLASAPVWLRLPLLAGFTALVATVACLLWRWWGPSVRRRPMPAAPPSREQVETRVASLRKRKADTASLDAELRELDRRRDAGELHVALFGEISTGKSSLIRALTADGSIDVDVRGGTTRSISQHRGRLRNERDVLIADVPGSREVGGANHERIARDEALRAHVVVYVGASDLTAAQDAELRWLAGFGKPMLLALNKIDQYDADERAELLSTLRRRYGGVARIIAISAGGSERFERVLADGRREQVERERIADIDELVDALLRLTAGGAMALEPAREAAVLTSVEQRSAALERERAAAEADACITRYTRRAIVGAMAAVAPGSDLLIQGALGTALVRELARIHDVPVRDIDIDSLLNRLGLTVRNTTAIVLAIAGNAMKAFPGLGTLGGGVLHAIAYGLVFDSIGHALAASLAERQQLDLADAEQRTKELLGQAGRDRIERIARLALDSLRRGDAGND